MQESMYLETTANTIPDAQGSTHCQQFSVVVSGGIVIQRQAAGCTAPSLRSLLIVSNSC